MYLLKFRAICLLGLLLLFGNLVAQVPGPGQYIHRILGTPQIVIFRDSEKPNFEQWKAVVSKLAKYSLATDWKITSELEDDIGQKHYRIQQRYNGIPVRMSMGILHTQNSSILSLNGDFIQESQLQGKLVLDRDQARDQALKFLPSKRYYWQDGEQNKALQIVSGVSDTTYYPVGQLVYCAADFSLGTKHRLCYQFDVFSSEPLAGKSIFVDAETGEVIASNDLILHADSKGTAVTKYSGTQKITTDSISTTSFRLRGIGGRGNGVETYNLAKGTTYTAAVDFTDADNNWNNVNANKDEAATDAHWGAELTYDYYKTLHNRNSYDNNGIKILSYVHYGSNYNNAYWNGTCMTYGDGDGTTFTPLTALDVCGHEITHAVTSNTANLTYSYESGALNESFSDVFGQTIEIWGRPSKYSWKIGEDITPNGAGIRNMADPSGTGYSQPKFYKGNKWYVGTGDNGGVHYNSGVQNYWYYLIAQGASGTNEKGWNFKIDTLGIVKAGKIAYRTLSVYLTSGSQYADARTFSILSTADLYGQCSKEVIQVTNAWWVCGVGAKYDSAYVKAAFVGDTLACKSGTSMQFLNYSENYKSSNWYFGDGGNSVLTNPTHAYAAYGKFSVKLVVTSCFKNKKDSVTLTNYVKIDSTYDICKAFLLPKSGADSAVGCKGFVYDDGGEGNYGGNKFVRFKLKLPGADSIRYRFKTLDYESGLDSMVMYKNSISGANRLGQFTGNTLPLAGAWKTIGGSALWFLQYSDPMLEGKGFKVEYVGVFKPLKTGLGKDTIICNGKSVQLNAAAAGGRTYQYGYSWIGPGITGGGNAKLITPLVTQKFGVVLWDGCAIKPDTQYKTVFVKPALSVKISLSDTAVCIGKIMYLVAKVSGGDTLKYKYQWTNGLGTAALAQMKLSDTIWVYLTVTDGCSVLPAKDSARLDTYLPLIMTISPDTTICTGQTIDLVGTLKGGNRLHGGGSYIMDWSNGVQAGSITVNPAKSKWYYLTGSEGCSPNVYDSVFVAVRPPLYLSAVLDTVLCHGQKYVVNLNDTGGRKPTRKIVWDSAALVGNSVTVNPSTVGKTQYRVHVEDGCTVLNDTTIFTVDRLAALSAKMTLSDSILCFKDSTNLTLGIYGGRTLNRVWSVDAMPLLSTSLKSAPALTKYFVLNLNDACSIPFKDSVLVTVASSKLKLSLTAFDSTICAGSSVGFLTALASGGFGPYKYQWNDPMKQTTAKALGLGKGNYVVRVSDPQGCKDSLSLFVNEYRLRMQNLQDTTIARGGKAKLYAYHGSQWRWLPSTFVQNKDTLSQTIFATPLDSMVYRLIALDSNGCLFRDTVNVRVVDPELVRIPNIITPNGDNDNEFWDLTELFEYNQRRADIFNRAGILVYWSKAYQNNWNAKDMDGNELPAGIYFYRLKHNKTGEEHRGFIQVVR